jgi:hypothetical protein
MEEGRYTNATQLLPTMVSDRMVDEVTASISLMWIKKGRKGDGAKLTWESVVDVGASSPSIPGNGARKES